jgi:hypothetical protein
MPKGRDFLWLAVGIAAGMFVVPKVRAFIAR